MKADQLLPRYSDSTQWLPSQFLVGSIIITFCSWPVAVANLICSHCDALDGRVVASSKSSIVWHPKHVTIDCSPEPTKGNDKQRAFPCMLAGAGSCDFQANIFTHIIFTGKELVKNGKIWEPSAMQPQRILKQIQIQQMQLLPKHLPWYCWARVSAAVQSSKFSKHASIPLFQHPSQMKQWEYQDLGENNTFHTHMLLTTHQPPKNTQRV